MRFIQKGNFLSSREYIIEQEGVRLIRHSLFGTFGKFYNFHHIGNEIVVERERQWWPLLFVPVLLAVGIWLLFDPMNNDMEWAYTMIGSALFIAVISFFSVRKHLYLVNGRYSGAIKFLANNPSEEGLLRFIEQIKKAQRIRLQQMYLPIDENISYNTYRKNVQWLQDNNFISSKHARQKITNLNLEL